MLSIKHHFSLALGLFILLVLTSNLMDISVYRYWQLDSIGHFAGFVILTAVCVSFIRLPYLTLIMTLVIYAGITEYVQYFLGFRNGDVKDFLANGFGVNAFVLLHALSRLCFSLVRPSRA